MRNLFARRLATTRGRTLIVMPVALLSVGLLALLPLVADPRPASAAREIVLIARGMSFYLDGAEEPNPVVRVYAGEQVRVVLRNEDPGYIHTLTIAGLAFAIGPVKNNQADAAILQVPEAPGTYEYICTPHAKMMRGAFEVTAP